MVVGPFGRVWCRATGARPSGAPSMSGEFIYKVSTITPNGSASSAVSSLLSARVDRFNQSGHQIMARDAEFSVMLVSLLGRAGLDLGLGLSFSSAAVYTRSGPYVYFVADD